MATVRRALVLLVALVTGLGVSGTELHAKEPAEPVAIFKRYYRERDPKTRKKAVEQLSTAGGADVIVALLTALADEDERVRGAAARLLHTDRTRRDEIDALAADGLGRRPPGVRLHAARALARGGARGAAALTAALADRQADVREAAARGLGSLRYEPAVRALHEGLRDSEAAVRAAACDAIGQIRGRESVGMACAVVLGDRATAPRVAAALVLGRFPDSSAIAHIGRGLRNNSWSLRVACARALGGFSGDADEARAAAALLVPALDGEPRLRVAEEISSALFRLTGIDFGPEPDRWTAWYAEAGRTFEPPDRPPKRGTETLGGTRAGLLDLPLGSDHVCFVLDSSHSMEDPIRFGVEKSKRQALLEAFERCVQRLPGGAFMNVITFGTEPRPLKKSLFPATRRARRDAVRFLAKRAPDGSTNIWDSLALALRDPRTDTVVLVTDGAPSAGARKTRSAILAGLRDLNRYRLVRVHTVEIGAANTGARWRGFLADIAESTGGHYLGR
jgi:HEAT repeat protein